ncbi:MAG: TonB-dependent receptor, partial [Chloroflexia bacterium]|nr:TonB-dependent receptor [Chloroflexia bacterium]
RFGTKKYCRGGTFSIYNREKFNPTYEMGSLVKDYNDGSFQFSQTNYTELSNYLTYSKLFAEKYNLNVMIGHEAQLTLTADESAARKDFPTDVIQTIGAGDPATATNSGSKGQSAVESYFGRVNFAFNDRYLLTGNARYDGNSMYSEANRWILSYSGALAWKINNEAFLKKCKIC